MVYFDTSVYNSVDDYIDFLLSISGYNLNVANTRIWELMYGLRNALRMPFANPKVGRSNFIRYCVIPHKLQRQEIENNLGDFDYFKRIINRRNGTFTATKWKIAYRVYANGDILIYKVTYSDINSESEVKKKIALNESTLRKIIRESLIAAIYG